MVYDSARDRAVLFGGSDGTHRNDTWEWNGTNWNQLNPVTSPTARVHHAMAYDSTRARATTFGGVLANGQYTADTWEWDGGNWINRAPSVSPSARYVSAMAFDSARRRIVLFGGGTFATSFSDTWDYSPTLAGSFTTTGSGCAVGITPALDALATTPNPWSGYTFTMRVSQLPIGFQFFAYLVVGFANPSQPLPWPPCVQRVSGNSFLLLPAGGTATMDLVIPANPIFIGTNFYAQAAVLDFAGQSPLHSLSNGVMGVVGTR